MEIFLFGLIRESLKGVWLAVAGVTEQRPLVEEAWLLSSYKNARPCRKKKSPWEISSPQVGEQWPTLFTCTNNEYFLSTICSVRINFGDLWHS
jgi:hypothetical protein